MNVRNRLALTPAGNLFTQASDGYIGYAFTFLGAVLTILCLIAPAINGSFWFIPAFIAAATVLWTVFGFWVQYAAVRKMTTATQNALFSYVRLSGEDKQLLPHGTADMLFTYDSISAAYKVTDTIHQINEAKNDATLPILEDFMSQLDITQSVLKDQKELR